MSLKLIQIAILPLSLIFMHSGWAQAPSIKDIDVSNDSLSHQPIRIINLPGNDTNYVSVLKPPLSSKIRSGFVTLLPKCSGEEHSTEAYEEMIIILSGQAVLHCGDTDHSLTTCQVAYVPPHTRHLIRNIGNTTLKYLYIVAKVE
jgi:mannose-6-phosphate isomerase-like protein (cupin superfamily)